MMAFFLIGPIWQGLWKLRRQNVKTFQGMLISRRYGICTMLMFMEYLKKDCISKDGKLCDFFQAHDWVGPSQEKYLSQFQIPITLVTI